jgi:hypothetical protein
MHNIYPIVVPSSYLDVPPEARGLVEPGSDAFGILRPIGNDLFSLLVEVTPEFVRNLHDTDLPRMGLDRPAAEQAALSNLSRLATGPSIERQVTGAPTGLHVSVWFGDRLTSSCILWPGLYDWARRELQSDRIIASVPQAQFLCVASRATPPFAPRSKGIWICRCRGWRSSFRQTGSSSPQTGPRRCRTVETAVEMSSTSDSTRRCPQPRRGDRP